jgi:ATP-dependent exoDNAse (exonuclease V) beta subunit (contains helicase and exonuclease domains)
MQRFKPEILPISGRHLIEASAGTGKTFALMSLAIQSLAVNGVEPEHLLLMTFTRASTRELRARLHARLHEELIALEKHTSVLPTLYPDIDPDVMRARLYHAHPTCWTHRCADNPWFCRPPGHRARPLGQHPSTDAV